MFGKKRKRGWFGKFVCGAVIGVGASGGLLSAAEPPPTGLVPIPLGSANGNGVQQVMWGEPDPLGPSCTSCKDQGCDSCAPASCDPISRVPNFFGDFVARTGNVDFPNVAGFAAFPLDSLIGTDLANPSGGGVVGRNNWFDNGSPVPHDRLYFNYDHVGDFRSLGQSFNVDRYVFGAEKAILDDRFSIEVRVPFAGTADNSQTIGDGLSVDHVEFGNVGLAFKAAVVRTPNFCLSIGLGLSFPTACDSTLFLGAMPEIEIENRAVLLQPLLGIAWAPDDRFYAQFGLQFDLDPTGNPVKAAPADLGNLVKIGVLTDQDYAFLTAAVGYWVFQNPGGRITGIALQGELDYDRSFGSRDIVQDAGVTVSDSIDDLNVLMGSAGVICTLGSGTYLSLGVNFPLNGDHQYDWGLVAQVNCYFGGPR